MKPLLILICLLPCMLHSQTSAAPALPKKLIRISTPMLNVVDNDSSVLVLKMEFNGSIPKSKLAKIKMQDIESISLAYSRYRLSDMFDQMTLNAQRMDKLYALMPGLKENKAIQWYWVEQTGCDNPDACNDYFHGFVIRLKSESHMLLRKTEESLMDYYMTVYEGGGDTEKMDSLLRDKKMKLIKTCDTINIRTLQKGNRIARIRSWDNGRNDKLARLLKKELADSGVFHLEARMDRNGHLASLENSGELGRSSRVTKLLNDNLSVIPARYMNRKIETKVSITIQLFNGTADVQLMQTPILPDNGVFVLDKFLYHESSKVVCDYLDTSGRGAPKPVLSSTPDIIFRVFDRNRQWKNCLITTDVTGSMYPYLAQFKVWHKINLSSNSGNHDFVFFNDGNNMPDFMKVTGRVGGIYYLNTHHFDSLSRYMSMSMNRGGGGDGPENNIEAVIEGLKKNPQCREVIMIADNWATPRDLSLLGKVNVPIRLILCGAQAGINTAYLDMIRKNRGSIHTMEQDLYDLSRLKEGQSIELDGINYIIKNGVFTVAGPRVTMR
jgi:hypothetical protein